MISLTSEKSELSARLAESQEANAQLQRDLEKMQETSQSEVSDLLDKLDGKTKAGM